MEEKKCNIRHVKVLICACSQCGGFGSVLIDNAITVCPLCSGNGYIKEIENEN